MTKMAGICFRQKITHNRLLGENNCGFTNWLSPQCGAYSRDLLDEKSRVPAIPGGLGDLGYK